VLFVGAVGTSFMALWCFRQAWAYQSDAIGIIGGLLAWRGCGFLYTAIHWPIPKPFKDYLPKDEQTDL